MNCRTPSSRAATPAASARQAAGDHVRRSPASHDASDATEAPAEQARPHSCGDGQTDGVRGAAEDRRRERPGQPRRLQEDGEADRPRGPVLHRGAARPAVVGVPAQALDLDRRPVPAPRRRRLPVRPAGTIRRAPPSTARRTSGGTVRGRGTASVLPPPRRSRRPPRSPQRQGRARRGEGARRGRGGPGSPAPPRTGDRARRARGGDARARPRARGVHPCRWPCSAARPPARCRHRGRSSRSRSADRRLPRRG